MENKNMRDIFAADTVKTLMQALMEKGCFFEYFYEKEEEKEIYICRFKKGKEYLDWRESVDGKEIQIAVSTEKELRVLPLKAMYRKEHRRFWWKHLFKRVKADERRVFVADLLMRELTGENPTFYGMKL